MKSFRTFAGALALFPVAVSAQQQVQDEVCLPPGEGDAEPTCIFTSVPIVVTGTRAPQAINETGQAITLIDRAAIDIRQLSALSDLLATTPGVTVSRNGGPGQPTAIRIRGAEDAQTLVLIDGVRVNDPSAPAGAFDFGNLLTGAIERVEVLRGPNSVPWGSQAIGGIVNIVTTRDTGAQLSAEYGAHDNAFAVAQGGVAFGEGGMLSGGGSWYRDDGISAYRFGAERDGYRQHAGNARLDLPLAGALSLDLRGYYASSRVQYDGFPPPLFAFADTNDRARTEQGVAYAGLRYASGDFDNRVAFTLSDVNRDATGTSSFTARGRTERFEYVGDAKLSGAIRLVFGAEHERTRFADGFAHFGTHVTSGYAQAIVKPAERLMLTGGVRIDDHRAYGTQATLGANLAWRMGDTLIRASYAEGFKAPTLFQLYSFFGTPSLDPERARGFDLGVEHGFGRVRAGLTAFRRTVRGQIDFNPLGTPAQPFGFYDNIDRTRAQGFEAFADARLGALAVTANYSFTDARDRVAGTRLLRRPKHSFNLSADWRGPCDLKLGASVQAVSASRDLDFVTFAPTRLGGYVLLGLRGSLPLAEGVEVYARVENLLDARYETVSGYGALRRNAHVGVRARL